MDSLQYMLYMCVVRVLGECVLRESETGLVQDKLRKKKLYICVEKQQMKAINVPYLFYCFDPLPFSYHCNII